MNGAINQAQLAADRRYRMEDILPFGAVERRRGRRAHETLTFGVGGPWTLGEGGERADFMPTVRRVVGAIVKPALKRLIVQAFAPGRFFP